MKTSVLIFALGFLAQFFFSARTLLQWVKSEKARSVVSPSSYWVLSIIGALLMFVYGWLRNDFAIILGQFLTYYIYISNLGWKGIWKKLHLLTRILLLVTPVAAVLLVLKDVPHFVDSFFRNEEVPFMMLVYGSAGQIIFTLRFIYQWFYSVRRHQSQLPLGFWLISLIGSSVIISYGIFRMDPVLILGQSFGFVAYLRNLMIGFRSRGKELGNE